MERERYFSGEGIFASAGRERERALMVNWSLRGKNGASDEGLLHACMHLWLRACTTGRM